MQKPMLGEMIDWSDPINQGLVLLLRLNEGIGDHVSDLSLNDNHGTLENFTHPGTPSSGWTPGFRGKTIAFDGVNDRIDCGNSESLNIGTAFSVCCWANPKNAGSVIVGKREDGDTDFWELDIANIGNSLFRMNATSDTILEGSNYLVDDGWVYLCGTYDGSAVILYENGIVVDSGVNSGSPDNPSDLEIGYRGYSGSEAYFGGSIDEVRIYNRALLSSEITRLYMEGMPSKSTTHA